MNSWLDTGRKAEEHFKKLFPGDQPGDNRRFLKSLQQSARYMQYQDEQRKKKAAEAKETTQTETSSQ